VDEHLSSHGLLAGAPAPGAVAVSPLRGRGDATAGTVRGLLHQHRKS
jgi:hypothetical protein